MTDPRHDLGHRAEAAAASWLSERGWTILARRWRVSTGEIDLVCVDRGGALVGVEVKLRRTGRSGSAWDALDRRRIARLRTTLAGWASASRARYPEVRLDLVTLVPAPSGLWRISRLEAIDRW